MHSKCSLTFDTMSYNPSHTRRSVVLGSPCLVEEGILQRPQQQEARKRRALASASRRCQGMEGIILRLCVVALFSTSAQALSVIHPGKIRSVSRGFDRPCESRRRLQHLRHYQHPAISTRSVALAADVSSLLYEEHEKLLVRRGELEEELMTQNQPLAAHVVKGMGGGGGFGGGGAKKSGGKKNSQKSLLKGRGKAHAKILAEEGVVRIDNVLPPDLADSLRSQVYKLREESEELVQSGKVPSLARFADVLLTQNRRDMTLPLDQDWALRALGQILVQSAVGSTLRTQLGSEAILREWSCLMSDPGSQRQVVHPDTPIRDDPVLYTCFVALQDVTIDMGPTTWLPKTHNSPQLHEQFQDESASAGASSSPKDKLLQTQPSVLGLLPKGACAIFDSRILHCGGANRSQQSRALMYCSFQNPTVTNVGNPGSIRPDYIGRYALQQLQDELTKFQKGKSNALLQ